MFFYEKEKIIALKFNMKALFNTCKICQMIFFFILHIMQKCTSPLFQI
jgi:hypothetical protein